MLVAQSSPKARALKSCVQRVVYIATPSPPPGIGGRKHKHKDTPDPRVRKAEVKKSSQAFLRDSGAM